MEFLHKSCYINIVLIIIFMKNKTGFIFSFIAILVASIYIYTQKPHRNISNEKVEFVLFSDEFLKEFKVNEGTAAAKFLDKTVLVEGVVTEINMNYLTLDDKIYCKFEKEIPKNVLNTNLKVKGRCIGFDELLEQVKLDQCSIEVK